MERVLDAKALVVLGEGLAAGIGHFSLTSEVQKWSFPAQLAQRLGTPFAQPLMQPPGVGNAGFQPLPAIVPNTLQTSVVEGFPRRKADLGNLSVPHFTLSDSLRLRPKAPLIWTDDPKQTLANLILGIPGLTSSGSRLPTQVEYAKSRKPTLVLVALGYQEVLEPLVAGFAGSKKTDLAGFAQDYGRLLDELSGNGRQILVATIPNPLDTAYFSDLETAAHILRSEELFLKAQYGLDSGDLLNLEGLIEIGYQFTARQVSGQLPAGSVISTAEAEKIRRGVDRLNASITALAEEKRAISFDLHGYLHRVAKEGAEVGGKKLSAGFLGGFYLLNGVYPGPTGHALIANQMLALLEGHFGKELGRIDAAEVMKEDANTLSRIAEGPTFTEEYLEPRTALPPLPPADPSALNFFPPFDPKKFNIFPIQTIYPDSPFDFGGIKAANKCVPAVGIPAGGFSDPGLKKPLTLPEGLEQTLPLNKKGSYFGDALRAVDFPGEKPLIPGVPTFGASGNTFFGGLAMVDSHLAGEVHIRFSEPDEDDISRFEITLPGGLEGDDGVLAAPQFFKLPSQLNRVVDVPGLVSSGELNLKTGMVTNLHFNVIFLNTQILTLFNVNPGLPPGPLPQIFPGPPNSGSTWARFDQREDGKLDFSLVANLWLPLGEQAGGQPIRFPLPFGNPHLQCASIVARGTSLHPHIHLTTREPRGVDLGQEAPQIPVNTVREFSAFVHDNNFGDVFGLEVAEFGGAGTGRSHLMGRLRIQFGPRFGDSVPIQASFLPPGGLLSKDPEPLPYLPPGTSRGMVGFNERLRFPSGITYDQSGLSSSMDPNNLPLGAVDVRTGWVLNEFLTRGFVVQNLFVNLTSVEPCTPADSFNYQGPARFATGPGGELIFSFNGEVYIPYPRGFKFPSPTPDGKPGFLVIRGSRLDPFLRLQAMQGGSPVGKALASGGAIEQTSSIGQKFSYRYSIPGQPEAADEAAFEYTNHSQGGTFKLDRLSWLCATRSPRASTEEGQADTVTFGGFGSWSKDSGLHQVSVHISKAADKPYVGILVDGGTTSNVNTKPVDIETTVPIEAAKGD